MSGCIHMCLSPPEDDGEGSDSGDSQSDEALPGHDRAEQSLPASGINPSESDSTDTLSAEELPWYEYDHVAHDEES